MINLSSQPFLLSLEQAAAQTGDYTGYEALLEEQQSAFLQYVEDFFDADIAARKRFQFLKTVQQRLDFIRLKYSDTVKERNADFHRSWSLLITDTWQIASVGVKTLEFQSRCPSHMLAETEQSHTFPLCKWNASRSDLMELIVGVYQADVIRLQDDSKPSFALFAKETGAVFGITFSNPHDEMRKILTRKKTQTPFFNRIISCLKGKIDDINT
jgi:hypothetical protein